MSYVGHYAYFVPYTHQESFYTSGYSKLSNPYSGYVARVNLIDFKTVEWMDLSEIYEGLRGFSGGFASESSILCVLEIF